MPPYEVEYLTDPNTIFVTAHSNYHFADHQRDLANQIIDLLDQTTEITYLVVDMLEFKVD